MGSEMYPNFVLDCIKGATVGIIISLIGLGVFIVIQRLLKRSPKIGKITKVAIGERTRFWSSDPVTLMEVRNTDGELFLLGILGSEHPDLKVGNVIEFWRTGLDFGGLDAFNPQKLDGGVNKVEKTTYVFEEIKRYIKR